MTIALLVDPPIIVNDRHESGDTTFVRHAHPPAANDNAVAERPRIVAITGYAGSGKSTVAAALQLNGYTLRKFAGPLKAMMRTLYKQAGLDQDAVQARIEGDMKEVPDALLNGRTARQAMQWLGTAWGRELFGDDFWVGMWAAGLEAGRNYVVDDCRFENEAAMIRAKGGVIVRIDRPGVGPINDHVSENLPIAPDIVINNDGTIRDLEQRLTRFAA